MSGQRTPKSGKTGKKPVTSSKDDGKNKRKRDEVEGEMEQEIPQPQIAQSDAEYWKSQTAGFVCFWECFVLPCSRVVAGPDADAIDIPFFPALELFATMSAAVCFLSVVMTHIYFLEESSAAQH
jgi:hypothetical protein